MYEVVIHESADLEINASAAFYESRETDLGYEFLAELERCVQRIAENPSAYPVQFDEYRRSLMTRFPYGIVYRIQEQTILVFAVATCVVARDTGGIAI